MTDVSHTHTPNEAATVTHTVLRAEGLTCPSCVSTIERQLKHLPGVVNAVVKFASGRIEVQHDPAVASVAALEQSVARAGYKARAAAF
ncbi:MAG TPA: heavy metal-associated domain-containing protein [Trueperaceae bacterium]|nr:heavy metal-associated domain-containing protein [Trueperaceae bacterium]